MDKHTISALVENKFGVLARVSGMLSGRGFNIETLNVAPTENPTISRITATIIADEESLNRCIRQLDRLDNVITVQNYDGVNCVARELVLVRVRADDETRTNIIGLAEIFRAQVVDVAFDSLVLEFTGNANKTKAFLALMEKFDIIELIRTGTLNLERGMLVAK